jgi:hypothetical protein
MSNTFECQGRILTDGDLVWLRSWIGDHPDWSRFRLAKELCKHWNWTAPNGRLKDFAARTFLRKLSERDLIALPSIRTSKQRKNGFAKPLTTESAVLPPAAAVEMSLAPLFPLSFIIPRSNSEEEHRFHHYLARHHYLGFHRTVGENMKYLVRDRHGRDLACVLFGSAAWKTKPRDEFIGWSHEIRSRNLLWITNNTRFLILPSVRVPHLASHVLGRIIRRIRADWKAKYGHPVHLLETFVERDRFAGTCYKAANWRCVGSTTGRSRQDRYSTLVVPVKDIYLYPLIPHFKEALLNENG